MSRKTEERHRHRVVSAIRETAACSITDEEINMWAFYNILRRMNDKEHDDRCKARFGGLTQEEVKEEIRGLILTGKDP
jgi:hypothetical protein